MNTMDTVKRVSIVLRTPQLHLHPYLFIAYDLIYFLFFCTTEYANPSKSISL